MLDEVEALWARILARVDELEPLVREYQLTRVAGRMGPEVVDPKPPAASARARARASGSRCRS